MYKLLLAALALTVCAYADQVTLKNGDRLTGAVMTSDLKTLTLKSEFAGVVNIDWNAVDTITSAAPLYLTLKTGEVLLGPVETANGSFNVKTAETGTVTTAKANVQAIRSKDAEQAYEAAEARLHNPGLLDLWAGFLETGLSLSRGNSETTNFTVGASATRATTRDKLAFNVASLYTHNTVNGVSALAADAVRGSLRYDLNLSARAFAFGFNTDEYDKFQHLDLRTVLGGGFGVHLVKHDANTFDVFGGGSLDKEFYTTLTRSSGEALVGEEWNYKMGKSTLLNERFSFYPNMTNPGEYRATFTGAAVTAINKWLAFQITMSDVYVTNPPPAIKKNDLLLTTGIRLTFAR